MARTLVLNASYEALGLITRKRAVVLILADKAEVVEESDFVLHSASMSVAAPSVVRLKRFVKVPYRARTPLTKRAVLARDEHRCAYCRGHGNSVDHVVPRSRGGRNDWENVTAACRACNAAKDDRLLSELGWTCHNRLYQPSGTHWLIIGLAEIDPAWGPYLDGDFAVA